MITWLAWATGLLSLAVGVAALVATVRGRRIDDVQLLGSAVLELALLVQGAVGAVLLVRTERPVDGVLFASYLLTSVLVVPLGAFWAVGERSRWGTGVLAVAALTTGALVLRLEQIWRTGG